ncbi:MAG TPA: zinc ribbon domain-containing protein [Candidatus Krumholzibacteria bacterium]|nr:zinc ribbon domain-containing protein [Candidatus Krumholzibacteria bacterium]
MDKREMIIPPGYNLPKEVAEIEGKDGETYLQFNTGMLTLYKQTYGEMSRFFIGLREGELLGARCRKCKQVMVPAATWHCPDCNFAPMEEIALPHRGVLAATAPITFFPSATFVGKAPFCRGYIDIARDAPAASFLPCRLRTTTGIPRPGIFVKGLDVKLVFEDNRQGTILDIFAVPMSEVPEKLRNKEPLLASQLNLANPPVPEIREDKKWAPAFKSALSDMRAMAAKITPGSRAAKDLADRSHTIGVKTGGGEFCMAIANGRLEIADKAPKQVDFTMTVEDPVVFTRWVKGGSLSDAVMEGLLWLPNLEAFPALYALDRLPRSIRRAEEEK